MSLILIQDRHPRSILSGDLCTKTLDLRLKYLKDDNYKKYLRCQYCHEKTLSP